MARMHAIQLLGVLAALAFSSAAFAQASIRSEDEKHRKKPTTSSAPTPHAPPKARTQAPPTPPKPHPVTRSNEFTREPYRPRTERDYEPWRGNRQSTPPRTSSPSTPKTQSVKSTPKPAETPRDPALARCDDLKRQMEQLVRQEGFGGDAARQQGLAAQKRALYQEELRSGCI